MWGVQLQAMTRLFLAGLRAREAALPAQGSAHGYCTAILWRHESRTHVQMHILHSYSLQKTLYWEDLTKILLSTQDFFLLLDFLLFLSLVLWVHSTRWHDKSIFFRDVSSEKIPPVCADPRPIFFGGWRGRNPTELVPIFACYTISAKY